MKQPIVVSRPPATPYRLVKLADERGIAPEALLRGVVGKYPTFAAAAADLGVTRQTLRSWLRRFNIVVADGAGS